MTDTQVKLPKVELRELQSLLRKKYSNDLEVIKYSTDSLLPPGENYGSTIMKVHAIVKKNANAKEEDVHLVAKMLPPTEFQRIVFDSSYTFKKEAFLYEELIPSYQNLERELGLGENEVFDIVPEFFGARYSLKSDDEFDDDAVLLMQNLKVLGYYTGDRKEGLDLKHAKVAVSALARFHALGIAMRQHKPDYFAILKLRSKNHEIKQVDRMKAAQAFLLQVMIDDPEMGVYKDRLTAAMSQGLPDVWTHVPPEDWSTIIHADFWVNNFMFRKDPKTGQIVDIKFVDFQNYLTLSPLQELTFFLMESMNGDVMRMDFDGIIDTYYDVFLGVLKRMKCDVEPFSREKFDERLKIDAFREFPRCPFFMRIVSAHIKEESSPDEVVDFILQEQVSPLFIEKMRRCVKKYVEKGWFGD